VKVYLDVDFYRPTKTRNHWKTVQKTSDKLPAFKISTGF